MSAQPIQCSWCASSVWGGSLLGGITVNARRRIVIDAILGGVGGGAVRIPVILLSGQAGCGKDTVAGFLAKNHGAVCIAQADPMKRLAAKLFGFSEETLWGPSERRNDERFCPNTLWGDRASFVSSWLDEVLPGQNRDSAGSYLRDWLSGLWEHSRARAGKVSARHVLQTLGTEWGRAFSRNMWVDLALRNARTLLEDGGYYSRALGLHSSPDGHTPAGLVVVTDGRFRNEILAVRAAGGATVKIVSPGSGLTGDAAKHSSETEQDSIPETWFDAVLHNDKALGLAQLESLVWAAVETLNPKNHWVDHTWLKD